MFPKDIPARVVIAFLDNLVTKGDRIWRNLYLLSTHLLPNLINQVCGKQSQFFLLIGSEVVVINAFIFFSFVVLVLICVSSFITVLVNLLIQLLSNCRIIVILSVVINILLYGLEVPIRQCNRVNTVQLVFQLLGLVLGLLQVSISIVQCSLRLVSSTLLSGDISSRLLLALFSCSYSSVCVSLVSFSGVLSGLSLVNLFLVSSYICVSLFQVLLQLFCISTLQRIFSVVVGFLLLVNRRLLVVNVSLGVGFVISSLV